MMTVILHGTAWWKYNACECIYDYYSWDTWEVTHANNGTSYRSCL